ncbi:hypothetical protein ACLMJK_007747 [Lecanora helva]
MQLQNGWSAPIANTFLVFFFVTESVSAAAVIGTGLTTTSLQTNSLSISSSASSSTNLTTSISQSSQNKASSDTNTPLTSPSSSTSGTTSTTLTGSNPGGNNTSLSGITSGSSSPTTSNTNAITTSSSLAAVNTTSNLGVVGSNKGSIASSLSGTASGLGSLTTSTSGQPSQSTLSITSTSSSSSGTMTPPPVTTTLNSQQVTSSVSSVSTDIAALIPIISSWKANPTSLKTDTLNKIKPIVTDVEDLIDDLGGDSSSGCSSKRKRGPLGSISDIISGLSCIERDLEEITSKVTSDITDIDTSVDDLTTQNKDLTNGNNDSKSKPNSEPSNSASQGSSGSSGSSATSTGTSTRLSTSSSSASTCTSQETALRVTIRCAPTVLSASISTTTCSTFTTVTASGCSVTGLTTTMVTSASATGSQVPCASDTCGDACPKGGGPLSGASMALIASTEDCASISTSTTASLPTASYGAIGGDNSKRSLPVLSTGHELTTNLSLMARALPDVSPPYGGYVSGLNPNWVSQTGDTSGQFFTYPSWGHSAAGVNGIYGCTSVIVASEKGVFISHIWENPVFIDGNFNPTDDASFTTNAVNALRDGTEYCQSITGLTGTDSSPGPLNAIYAPKVFVLTPFTTDWDRAMFSITTQYRYEARANQLASSIARAVPGSGGSGRVLGYTRTNQQASTGPGTDGRAIWEVDPFQYWLTSQHDPNSAGLQVGRWRLWVEDQLIGFQDFWLPNTSPPPQAPQSNQKRDVGYPNPCGSSSQLSGSVSRSATDSAKGSVTGPAAGSTTGSVSPTSNAYSTTSGPISSNSNPSTSTSVAGSVTSSLQSATTAPPNTDSASIVLYTPSSTAAPPASGVCQGNQIEGSCTEGHYPTLAPYSGAQQPICNKVDDDQNDYVRINDDKAKQAASDYCNNLKSGGVVLSATSDSPKPGTVAGAAEKGGMLSLTVQFDVAGCPTDKSMSTIDFTKMSSDECVQNLYQTVSTDCSQDSTWGDYDPDYTLEGGVFLSDCGLWSMVGEPST